MNVSQLRVVTDSKTLARNNIVTLDVFFAVSLTLDWNLNSLSLRRREDGLRLDIKPRSYTACVLHAHISARSVIPHHIQHDPPTHHVESISRIHEAQHSVGIDARVTHEAFKRVS